MSRQRVVLASNNPGKLREIREIFRDTGYDLVPQSEFDVPEVAETGDSFVVNALIKARHAAGCSGIPAIADDSGIEVDILNGAPGIYSARYAGEDASDEDNLNLLLANIVKTGEQNPVGRFKCAMVYVRNKEDPSPVIAEGIWEGNIVPEPRGRNGFGYDPIFYVPTHGCTSAELVPEIKNRISHRARALNELLSKLKTIHGEKTV